MLQGNFYTILNNQAETGSVNLLLELNPDHHIFEGHFPQLPVVPGVCMMQMVKELVEDFTGQRLRLAKADHLKFLTIINPRENKLLQVDIAINSRSTQGVQVTASFFHQATVFFKFKGGFVIE
ncbi:MAG: 3-hydroxyacyl-ACP dehydratase [Chitinophagaceae bacterium]|nr:3-hydroxyacyl-ACP dehydratase [Chitinophagaceae bacterium]